MYIVVGNQSQLGNQLFLAAHVIATAREHRHRVINLSFVPFGHLFPATADDWLCRYPPRPTPLLRSIRLQRVAYRLARAMYHSLTSDWLQRLPVRLVVVRSGHSSHLDTTKSAEERRICDLNSPEIRDILMHHRVVFMFGPHFRNFIAMHRQAPAIREYFRPPAAVAASAQAVEAAARAKGDVLVGIHIRRGDYQTFIDGRYYYPVEDYLVLMERVLPRFPGRKVVFCICSDERFTAGTFVGHNHIMGPGRPMEDIYTLARCDFLIGPPSTFSAWASFYGLVPLYFMRDPLHVPQLSEFEPTCG